MTTTDRVFKTHKVIKVPISITHSTDEMLTDAAGANKWDISDVNWERIVVEGNITTITGSTAKVNLKILTSNDSNAGATTDTAAVKGNGSTAMASGDKTATGRFMFATGKSAADGSAASNIGKYIELLADKTNAITSIVGDAWIYVEGK